jgi:hypothetical protein
MRVAIVRYLCGFCALPAWWVRGGCFAAASGVLRGCLTGALQAPGGRRVVPRPAGLIGENGFQIGAARCNVQLAWASQAGECNMNHHTAMLPSTSSLGMGQPASSLGSWPGPSTSLDQQRLVLQRQVEALRLAGTLPSAAVAAGPASVVQWNNWSNG